MTANCASRSGRPGDTAGAATASGFVVAALAAGAPHSEQNFAPAGRLLPQRAQPIGSLAPHSAQNFAVAGFSYWQAGQSKK